LCSGFGVATVVHASADGDLDTVFATLIRLPAGGLVIAPDPFFGSRIEKLAALATRHAVPTIYKPDFAAAGGLMGLAAWRAVGTYTGRILKGDKPGDLHTGGEEFFVLYDASEDVTLERWEPGSTVVLDDAGGAEFSCSGEGSR
jgi:hypothetical protein